MKKLVEVKNLTVKYRDQLVLDNVSFEICEGELVSLIGLNGSGKSTLLKAIIGLVQPAKGEVKCLTDKVFYIPQRNDFNDSFPVSVAEMCELFGAEGYQEYLKEVGVKKFLKKDVAKLSGGELQRVLIGLALSRKPDLLLLDEPTSGVDLIGESSFYKMIEEIRREYGVAIVLVSHDIHLVTRHADKVLCISGHVCCKGTPQEVADSNDFKKIFGEYLTPYIHHHNHKH